MRRLGVLLCLLLLGVPAAGHPNYFEDGILVVHVTNVREEPISGAVVSPKGDGSISPPTDQAGRTRIKLPRGMRPGKWITLQLIKGPRGTSGWCLVSPWGGRAPVPSFDDEADNYLPIVIAKRGERIALRNQKVLVGITAGILEEIAATSVGPKVTAEQRKAALILQADVLGIPPEEIDDAIRKHFNETDNTYEKGLAALYAGRYSEASQLLSKYLNNLEKQSDRAAITAFFLGQSLFLEGKYSEAANSYDIALSKYSFDPAIHYAKGLAMLNIANQETTTRDLGWPEFVAASGAAAPSVIENLDKARLLKNLNEVYANREQATSVAMLFQEAESTVEIQEYNVLYHLADERFSLNLRETKGQSKFTPEEFARLNEALQESRRSGNTAVEARALANLGFAYYTEQQYKAAADYYINALPILRTLGDKNTEASVLASIGDAYLHADENQKAIEYYNMLLPLADSLGENQIKLLALHKLGHAYFSSGDTHKALTYFNEALLETQKIFGQDDPSSVLLLYDLASIYTKQAKYGEAEAAINQVLSIREKILGVGHVYTADGISDLAMLYRKQQKYAEAEQLYKEALAISERSLGTEHFWLVNILNGLAALYNELGKYSDAEGYYKRALSILDKPSTPRSHIALQLSALAKLYEKEGKTLEADAMYNRAASIVAGSDRTRTDLTDILRHYAAFLRKNNRAAEAAALEAQIATREDKNLPKRAPAPLPGKKP